VLILCNPHNPGGRVWTADELREIAAICYDSGTFVISDEIHADLTLPPYKHYPFATVSEEAAANSLRVSHLPGGAVRDCGLFQRVLLRVSEPGPGPGDPGGGAHPAAGGV